jgi:hypothetical protein
MKILIVNENIDYITLIEKPKLIQNPVSKSTINEPTKHDIKFPSKTAKLLPSVYIIYSDFIIDNFVFIAHILYVFISYFNVLIITYSCALLDSSVLAFSYFFFLSFSKAEKFS